MIDLVYKVAAIIADDEQNDKVREYHLRKARRVLALLGIR